MTAPWIDEVRRRLHSKRVPPKLSELGQWEPIEDFSFRAFVHAVDSWLESEAENWFIALYEDWMLHPSCRVDGRASTAEATVKTIQLLLLIMEDKALWPPQP